MVVRNVGFLAKLLPNVVVNDLHFVKIFHASDFARCFCFLHCSLRFPHLHRMPLLWPLLADTLSGTEASQQLQELSNLIRF